MAKLRSPVEIVSKRGKSRKPNRKPAMRMNPLPLVFLAAPLAEIVAFGIVVQWLGFWSALALVLLTSLVGLLIVRHQGFGLISKLSRLARDGNAPGRGVGADLLILIAGLLLLIPGFLTDIIGLVLLLPFVRKRLSRAAGVKSRVYSSGTYSETYDFGSATRRGSDDENVVDLGEDEYRTSRREPGNGGNKPRIEE